MAEVVLKKGGMASGQGEPLSNDDDDDDERSKEMKK